MIKKYLTWIFDNVEHPLGRCAEYTERMKQEFPELTRVRGHYDCTAWGRRPHWWLVDPEGEIVDPTAQQFPSLGTGTYIPLEPDAPEPEVCYRCHNCGEYYPAGPAQSSVVCSDACGDAYAQFCLEG